MAEPLSEITDDELASRIGAAGSSLNAMMLEAARRGLICAANILYLQSIGRHATPQLDVSISKPIGGTKGADFSK